MRDLKPCWSCGAEGPCYYACDCAKCVDPDGYDDCRYNNPEEYQDWLDRQDRGSEFFAGEDW